MVRHSEVYTTTRRKMRSGEDFCVVLRALAAVCREQPQLVLPHDLPVSTTDDEISGSDVESGICRLQQLGFLQSQVGKRPINRRRRRLTERADGIALTECGRDLLCAVMDVASALDGVVTTPESRPHWDATRRELRFRDRVIKRFTRAAENQERLLCAFEESDWASEIDDPLPPRGVVLPADRLRNAVKRLNRTMCATVIEFGVNDHGTLATWHLR